MARLLVLLLSSLISINAFSLLPPSSFSSSLLRGVPSSTATSSTSKPLSSSQFKLPRHGENEYVDKILLNADYAISSMVGIANANKQADNLWNSDFLAMGDHESISDEGYGDVSTSSKSSLLR